MAPSNDTTAPLRAKIIRKRTKVKASIAATAPGSPKKRPTHQATAAAKSKAKATPRKRQPLPPIPTAFQFQDDKTGRKLIHPAALRYSLKLVDDELQSSTKAIAQSLLEHNQVDESRQVQVRSLQHGKAIVAKVREKLRKVPIPARYIRIDDVNLADLDAANKRRMDEIEISKAMLRKLRKQKVILEQEHREARLARDECLEKQKQGELWELQTRKSTELQVHPLLQKAVAEKKKKVIVPEENKPLLVKRASDETKSISALLEQLPSAYS